MTEPYYCYQVRDACRHGHTEGCRRINREASGREFDKYLTRDALSEAAL